MKAKLERDNISIQFQYLKARRLNTGSTRVLLPLPHLEEVGEHRLPVGLGALEVYVG